MLQAKESLVGKIASIESLNGVLNNGQEKVYPELQEKSVMPSGSMQEITADDGVYGLSKVTVHKINLQDKSVKPSINSKTVRADSEYSGLNEVRVDAISTEEITVTPAKEEQIIETTDDVYISKVTVSGDNNLISDNIKEGVNIFGVDGAAPIIDLSEYFKTEGFVNSTSATSIIQQALLKIPDLDTSNISNFDHAFRYSGLRTAPNIDTSEATKMEFMFADCPYLVSFDSSNYNMSKVTSIAYMFQYCKNLVDLNVDNLVTSKTNRMVNVFYECSKIKNLDLSKWDTRNVIYGNSMFCKCSSLETLNVSNWNISSMVSLNSMFQYCSKLASLDLSTWDCSNITGINYIFGSMTNLTDLKIGYNLGKNFGRKTTNYYDYKFDVSGSKQLTHESLMNIFNNLYDLTLTYDVANGGTLYTQQLVIGPTNIAKMTEEELAIPINKGWTVS